MRTSRLSRLVLQTNVCIRTTWLDWRDIVWGCLESYARTPSRTGYLVVVLASRGLSGTGYRFSVLSPQAPAATLSAASQTFLVKQQDSPFSMSHWLSSVQAVACQQRQHPPISQTDRGVATGRGGFTREMPIFVSTPWRSWSVEIFMFVPALQCTR